MDIKRKNALWWGPWELKEGEMSVFTKVTEINRKNAITLGRILYIISKKNKNTFVYRGCVIVNPQATQGWWMWPINPFNLKPQGITSTPQQFKVYIDQDEDRYEWSSFYKKIINENIEAQSLYIKQTDKILKHTKL